MWLRLVSDARPSKLFTANGEIFLSLSRTGHLYTQKIREILQRVEIFFCYTLTKIIDLSCVRKGSSGLQSLPVEREWIIGDHSRTYPLLIRPGILARVLTVFFGVHYLASRRLPTSAGND